jgi:hypothetical protein
MCIAAWGNRRQYQSPIRMELVLEDVKVGEAERPAPEDLPGNAA